METFELETPDLIKWYIKTSDDGVKITNDSVKNSLFYCAENDIENTKAQLNHVGLVLKKLDLILQYVNDYHKKNIIDKQTVDYVTNNFMKAFKNGQICMNMINRCQENQ